MIEQKYASSERCLHLFYATGMRIGLSNHRLLRWHNGQITLAYHDYRTSRASRLQLTPAWRCATRPERAPTHWLDSS